MIITSFSAEGYEEYGKRFIEGFLSHWPPDESLAVYTEGQETCLRIAAEFPSVKAIDLLQDKDFVQYAALLEASDPLFRGRMRDPNTGKATYNFRYDAHKFFRKVYAVVAYDKERETDEPFAWLDADIVFHRVLPKNFLKDTLSGYALAFLGRHGTYTETGFVAWDPTDFGHDQFMHLYLQMYLSGAFRLLTEWHDCQVFDCVRLLLEVDGRNLAKGCDPNHPFVYSVLGTYMDHLKGPERKELGHSPEGQAHVA